MFDSAAPYLDRTTRVQLAGELVEHFFSELVHNIAASLRDRQPTSLVAQEFGEVEFLRAMTAGDGKFQLDGGPHIDATHLNSVTRIGQIVSELKLIEKLLALSEYGLRLPEMFHFPGVVPLENHFADSVIYFKALAGRDIDVAVHHFQQKLVAAEGTPSQSLVAETLVDWLSRVGRAEQAVDVAIAYPQDDFGQLGIAPNLLEIARQSPEAEHKLADYFRDRGDLLSFLMTTLSH